MAGKTYLILDSSNLFYRAHYSVGELSHNGRGTGALYGVFQILTRLASVYKTRHVIWTWDFGKSLRYNQYPDYKNKRQEEHQSDKDILVKKELARQMRVCRDDILPSLGFNNSFYEDGYEADDVIASVVQNLPLGDEAVIVSTDKDLYQLISPRVKIHSPYKHNVITLQKFKEEHGISPKKWPEVKALMGDPSDCIQGIKGIGLKYALSWVKKTLDPKSNPYKKIEEGQDIFKKNLKLVTLPYMGCPLFELIKDTVNLTKWVNVMRRFGMKSFETRLPSVFTSKTQKV